jgi:hypothetical protein
MRVSVYYKVASCSYIKISAIDIDHFHCTESSITCFAGNMKYRYFISGDTLVFPETIRGLSLDISDSDSGTGYMAAGKHSDICE